MMRDTDEITTIEQELVDMIRSCFSGCVTISPIPPGEHSGATMVLVTARDSNSASYNEQQLRQIIDAGEPETRGDYTVYSGRYGMNCEVWISPLIVPE